MTYEVISFNVLLSVQHKHYFYILIKTIYTYPNLSKENNFNNFMLYNFIM